MKFRLSLFLALSSLLFTVFANAQGFMVRDYPIFPGNGIAPGDFNEDGIPDVVFQNNDGGLSVILGTAQGTLGDVVPSATDSGDGSFVVAKFTGSGHLDVALTHFAPPRKIDIMVGHGDGTFDVGQTVSLPNSDQIDSFVAADFDGDGKTDLAITSGANLWILKGNGNATFDPPKLITFNFHGSTGRFNLITADFDGDGWGDLALSDGGALIDILFNKKNLTFQQTQIQVTNAPVVGVSTGDVNQDGAADLLVTLNGFCPIKGPCEGGFAYYMSRGSERAFTQKFQTDPSEFQSLPSSLTVVDVNGDGLNDIIGTRSLTKTLVFVYLGQPDGSFPSTPLGFTVGDTDGGGLAVLDLNRDGRPDFVVPEGGNGTMLALLNAFPRGACTAAQASPSVTVCQPQDNIFSNSPLHIVAKAVNTAHHVTSIQAYVDNQLKASTTTTTLDTNLALPAGLHSLLVKAWDATGKNVRSNVRHVNVFSGTPGSICSTPVNTAKICTPAQGASVNSPVRILAAANPSLIFTSFQVYIDNQLKYQEKGANYVDQNFTLATGNHTIVVKCFDAQGSKFSSTETIHVN